MIHLPYLHFNSKFYDHMPKDKFYKLDKKVVKCIFINYVVGMKAYKIWDHVDEKVKYKNVVLRKLNYSPIVAYI